MSGSTINANLGFEVTLGAPGYTSPLIINATIHPGSNGAALYAPATYNTGAITNNGALIGANGPAGSPFAGYNGGLGVQFGGFYGPSTLNMNNYTVIQGGAGGANYYGGNGGIGVVLTQHDVLTNFGYIAGGTGGNDQAAKYARAGVGGVGVYVRDGATLINAGTIAGGAGGLGLYATPNTEGHANGTLVVDPGAVFDGIVSDANGTDVLVLASGSSTGTLSGIGTSFTGFGQIDIAPGAAWLISGDSAALTSGVIINGFSSLDTITAPGLSFSSETFANGTLTLFSGVTAALFFTEPAAADLTFSSANGSLAITSDVACFCPGTRIATPSGQTPVEKLQIGDLVLTEHAGPQPIKWLGRRSYAAPFCNNSSTLPIRIRAGALDHGIPARDPLVSPGHALAIDGHLIHASLLVNHASITQATRAERVDYIHIELGTHEIIFAEHCPAETFRGAHFRAQFSNAAEFAALYPDVPDASPCLPPLVSGFTLHAIQSRLARRAGLTPPAATGTVTGYIDTITPTHITGWAAHDGSTAPVSLDIFAGDERLGRVLANLYRADLRTAGYGTGHQASSSRSHPVSRGSQSAPAKPLRHSPWRIPRAMLRKGREMFFFKKRTKKHSLRAAPVLQRP
jgi:hypothetical protein